MADAHFWRRLASRFRATDPNGLISAFHFITSIHSATGWEVDRGASTAAFEERFKGLAREAGRAVDPLGSRDTLIVWLNALSRRAPAPYFEEADPTRLVMRIGEVCLESALLCGDLEGRMAVLERSEHAEITDTPRTLILDGAKRLALLNDYKSATSNPSNRRIYTARNSGVNKPEFYEWLRGELPETSKTTQKFEKFLLSKKHAIPRNQRQ